MSIDEKCRSVDPDIEIGRCGGPSAGNRSYTGLDLLDRCYELICLLSMNLRCKQATSAMSEETDKRQQFARTVVIRVPGQHQRAVRGGSDPMSEPTAEKQDEAR